jgi:hypothetical protein
MTFNIKRGFSMLANVFGILIIASIPTAVIVWAAPRYGALGVIIPFSVFAIIVIFVTSSYE